MIYDLIIIGSGPAGLTAGIYASRAKLQVVLLEGPQPGGQLTTTTTIENWPGEQSIDGSELMMKMMDHARQSGCVFVSENATRVEFGQKPFKVFTDSGKELVGNAVIVATGAVN
ncbi:MAG: FAD-dependent oxidoreductase, partial [Endomicrobiales bacterium]|nr:FAD-dependent oxidoreductase [Endomicrobiales bacterium]